MNYPALGKRIRKARNELGITSEALADKCGVNPVFIRQIENASRTPSLPTFVSICNALEVSPAYLLHDNLLTQADVTMTKVQGKLNQLSPKQVDMVLTMMDTMIEKFLE